MEPKNIEPFILSTTDSSGNKYTFQVEVTSGKCKNPKTRNFADYHIHYDFSIKAFSLSISDSGYNFCLINYSDGRFRVDAMSNQTVSSVATYSRKGITPAIISWASQYFQADIESSSNLDEYSVLNSEERNEQATQVWEKMVERGLARKDESKDQFVFQYKPFTEPS